MSAHENPEEFLGRAYRELALLALVVVLALAVGIGLIAFVIFKLSLI